MQQILRFPSLRCMIPFMFSDNNLNNDSVNPLEQLTQKMIRARESAMKRLKTMKSPRLMILLQTKTRESIPNFTLPAASEPTMSLALCAYCLASARRWRRLPICNLRVNYPSRPPLSAADRPFCTTLIPALTRTPNYYSPSTTQSHG